MTRGVNLGIGNDVEISRQLGDELASDLLRLGLLSENQHGSRTGLRLEDDSLRLFLPMLAAFDIRLVPVRREGCPVAFCTGLLKVVHRTSRGGQSSEQTIPAGGQGKTEAIAAIGCVGELSERLSLWSLGNSDNRVFQKSPGQPEVDFACLLGLSDSQSRNAAVDLGVKPDGYTGAGPDWHGLTDRRVSLRRLSDGQVAACPSFGVLFQEFERATGRRLSYASSVGCAVWPTLAGARERAALELAERDAIAQAWYNRLGITFVENSTLAEILQPDLLDYLNGQPRVFGIYGVETDLAVHVVMAISHDVEGRLCAFGSAAGWDIASACDSAIREMLQSENALTLMDRSYPATSHTAKVPRQLAYARQKSIFDDLPLKALPAADRGQLEMRYSFEGLLQSCRDRAIEIWEFDATRQDLAIPCIKLLSPDLCGWEPRFGKRRLFQGVVDRGLRRSPASEAEFAARPFPF
ncbi:YcaO-like family protein [Roseibium sp. M-1]